MNLYKYIFELLENKGITPQIKKELLSHSVFMKLCDFVANMFEYENIPQGFDTRIFELYFLFTGSSAVWKSLNNNYQVGFFTYSGKLDSNFNPLCVNIYTASDTNKTKARVNSNCVIGWNNSMRTSDIEMISEFCELLTETHTSIKAITKGSRLNKMFKCGDDNVKRNLENAIDNAKVGKPITFISKNPLEDLTSIINSKEIESIDLFNTEEITKLQYLTSSYNDILKMFFFYYGLTMGEGNKRAQQSIEEINNSADASFVFANSRLKERMEFCERFNNLFNEDLTVKFSESWKRVESVNE